MKKAIAVIALLASTISPAQGGEIAGTRVKGDVQLNCERQHLEFAADGQVWSYCVEPLKPTEGYNTIQPYGFKPSPQEEPFPYQVATPNAAPIVPVIVETSTVTTDTATVVTETTTATITSNTIDTLYAQIMALFTQLLALIAKLQG